MKRKKISETLGNINPKYIDEATEYEGVVKNTSKKAWQRWVTVAACLCLIIGLSVPVVRYFDNLNNNGTGTLMGDTEIYPTVMVNGQLYEWRKGVAICDELPNDSVYYGEVTHIDEETPTKDCEFVSAFSVSGQIYTVLENENCVYLCLSTDWLNETIVVFDLVSNNKSID